MPFKRSEYPPDWEERRVRILVRAGNKCEGSPKYPDCRVDNYSIHPVTGSKVVLTIGHVNHDKSNWDVKDEDLKAWCQRCHLSHDIKHHVANRKYGRDHNKNNLKLDL